MDDVPDGSADSELPLAHRTTTQRRWRFALAAATVVLILGVIAGVWRPLHEAAMRAGTALPTATATETPLPTPTPVLAPTPRPIVGALGLPPTNCPSAEPLDSITVADIENFTSSVPLFGQSPVWAAYLEPGHSLMTPPQPTPSPSATPGPSWPSVQIFWVLGPNVHPRMTVRATNLRTGEVAWWAWSTSAFGPQEAPLLTLDPALFPGIETEKWLVFRTTLYILHADCYELEAQWSGGSWRAIFPSGRYAGPPA
ncbi:MAG TPA: hypothetical protein VGF38_18540 [Ktedonobacterales bacterium]